jgi:hypothetical protein
MYDTTLKREQEIKTLGFQVVTIWERDWLKAVKTIECSEINVICSINVFLHI